MPASISMSFGSMSTAERQASGRAPIRANDKRPPKEPLSSQKGPLQTPMW